MKSILLLVLVGGCGHYAGYGRYTYTNTRQPAAYSTSTIPPGKILVQDVRTGRLILIDDPNAPPPAVQQPPQAPVPPRYPYAPRPRVQAPETRRPYAPRPHVPKPRVRVPQIPKPKIGLSLGGFMANLGGTLAGHDGLASYEVDLDDDVDLGGGSQVSLDFTMQFPRGPRFRMSLMAASASGALPPDPSIFSSQVTVSPPDEVPTELDVTIFDLAFSPMVRQARWGTLALETGLRYARSSVEIGEVGGQFSEGVMISLGGELDAPLYKDRITANVKLSAGLGADSAFIQFDTGIGWHPTQHLFLRLGYRFLGMVLVDRLEEVDERYLGITAGGLGLELGVKF
jgi:hypothetical protein